MKNYLNNFDEEFKYIVSLEKGTKFVQLLINALSQKKHNRYHLIYESQNINNNIIKNIKKNTENINIPNEIISILNKYNKLLQINIESFKTKRLENNFFKKGYEKYKKIKKESFYNININPKSLFYDLVLQYKNKKNLSITNDFLNKNTFQSCPLLLICQNDLINYFTQDIIENGFSSLGQYKTIWFLKRIINDLQYLIKKSSLLGIPKKKSFSVVNKTHKFLKARREKAFKILKKCQKQFFEINQSKEVISTLNKLIKLEEFEQKEKDKTFNNISQSYFSDYSQIKNDDVSSLHKKKNNSDIDLLNNNEKTMISKLKRNSIRKKFKNITDSTLFSKINNNSMNSSINIDDSINDNKTSTYFSKSSNKNLNMNVKKYNSYISLNKTNIEDVYNKLKQDNEVSKKEKGKPKINPLLSFYLGEKKIQNLNFKKNRSEIFKKLNSLNDKITYTNINKIIPKLYPLKIPNHLKEKLEENKKLDSKIKKLSFDFMNIMVKKNINFQKVNQNNES